MNAEQATADPCTSEARYLDTGAQVIDYLLMFARMSKRVGFMVYRDWREVLCDFDDKLYRELMEAIFDLALDNKETAKSPLVVVAMKLIKPQILRDWESYMKRCNRNKINGLQGGRPKTQNNPENPLGFTETQKTHSVFSVIEKPTGGIYIKNKKEEIKNEKEEELLESKDSLSVATDSDDKINYLDIVEFYNKSVKNKNMPVCIKLTEKRKAAIRARIKEYGADKVYEAIQRCVASSFCNGRNERNWKANFDFIFNANKMAWILEGKYDDSINHGTDRNNSGHNARHAGEEALRNIFAEIEERRRTEGVTD